MRCLALFGSALLLVPPALPLYRFDCLLTWTAADQIGAVKLICLSAIATGEARL